MCLVINILLKDADNHENILIPVGTAIISVAAVKIRIGRLLQAFPPSEPYVRLSPHTARTLSQLPLWLLVAGCFARPASCRPSEARAKNLRLGCWDVAVAEPMVTSLRKIL